MSIAEIIRASSGNKASIALAAVIACVLLFVWPTPYRYEKLKTGEFQSYYRINRFTGNVDQMLDGDWASQTRHRLAKMYTEKVHGKARLENETLVLTIYNGSPYYIERLLVSFEGSGNQEGKQMLFRVTPYNTTSLPPYEYGVFTAHLSSSTPDDDHWSWEIEEIYGKKSVYSNR